MISALILAGGIGSRMGADKPKLFLEIGGEPILVHTVRAFLRCPEVELVVVAATKGWLDYTEDILVKAFGEEERFAVTVGGADRLGSLMNACAFLSEKGELTEEDILLTHDGARPFVSRETILDNLEKIRLYDAVTTAVPSVDTILRSENGATVAEIPNRKAMYAMQTPQTFHGAELAALLAAVSEEERQTLTDATKIYLSRGRSVGIAKGTPENIKITERKDILFAEGYLSC